MSNISLVDCPVCGKDFPLGIIEQHAAMCLDFQSPESSSSSQARKKTKLDDSPWSRLFKNPTDVSTPKGGEASKNKTQPGRAKTTPKGNNQGTQGTGNDSSDEDIIDVVSPGTPLNINGISPIRNTSEKDKDVPLAERMRPDSLCSYVGQEKILGPQSMLRSLIEAFDIPSMILWGPPGCGKTTLAHIIASQCKQGKQNTRFVKLSAAVCGVGKVKEIIAAAQNDKRLFRRTTILFMDEIHRFNKLQQDTFLPHVENGTIILIGATTENPSFSLNNALLSRCKVFVLEKLTTDDVEAVLKRALDHLEIKRLDENEAPVWERRSMKMFIETKAVKTLASLCDGDARAALNALQMTVQSTKASLDDGPSFDAPRVVTIDEKHALEGFQRSHLLYDRAGEEHYNCISALHKSLRGSDANASLYWLGRMMMGGEDPLYVARRLVRFASEDIGLADPNALVQAVATYQACHFNGLPECKVNLAQCAVYLARAPKSIEVYTAYGNAEKFISSWQGAQPGVPLHLRNAPTRLMKDLGYAKGYKYNPYIKGRVEQRYLPDEVDDVDFFTWKPT